MKINRLELDDHTIVLLPSGIGRAFKKIRLCLLGDFDKHMISDSSDTVSRYDTTGSETLIGIQA